jgi:hypothetical protein
MPEVSGASATAVTPANAGACDDAEVLGLAVVLEGFRTLVRIPVSKSAIAKRPE